MHSIHFTFYTALKSTRAHLFILLGSTRQMIAFPKLREQSVSAVESHAYIRHHAHNKLIPMTSQMYKVQALSLAVALTTHRNKASLFL